MARAAQVVMVDGKRDLAHCAHCDIRTKYISPHVGKKLMRDARMLYMAKPLRLSHSISHTAKCEPRQIPYAK